MPPILDVAIGTVFIFLLFSLVVPALNEVIFSKFDSAANIEEWTRAIPEHGCGRAFCPLNAAALAKRIFTARPSILHLHNSLISYAR